MLVTLGALGQQVEALSCSRVEFHQNYQIFQRELKNHSGLKKHEAIILVFSFFTRIIFSKDPLLGFFNCTT